MPVPMDDLLKIIQAQEKDSEELTKIAFLSKRYWRYPEEYLKIWEKELTITPEYIRNNRAFMAVSDGETAGFYTLAEREGIVYLDHLFLKPKFTGKGIGTKLIENMISLMKEEKVKEVKVYVDPHAEEFYLKLGGVIENWVQSRIEGRLLPLYRFEIESR